MKILALITALLGLSISAQATPLTYVHVATFTAGGTGTKAFAFQNTSADLDVEIHEVTIENASPATVTSGPMQFWIYGATVVTHGGTSQVSFYSQDSANIAAPSYISVSTGPVSVVYEGKQDRQLPLSSILVNLDESAIVLPAPLSTVEDLGGSEGESHTRHLTLGRGANRALVFEQKQLGATDWTAGVAMLRIVYTVK